MAPTVRQRWQSVRAKEVNLLSALDGLNDVSTSREDNSERKVTVPVEKKMGKSPRLKPKGWARRGVKDDISKEPNALSPLTLTKPVTPPGLAAVPSPRAGRNQKSIPKLRDGKGTPLRKNGADVFDYLGYGGRDLVSKSLGISVSGSGEVRGGAKVASVASCITRVRQATQKRRDKTCNKHIPSTCYNIHIPLR